MLSDLDPIADCIRHRSVLACLLTLGQVHYKAITTVEGIGSVRAQLHPVQERLAKYNGTQCGYCSPGFVMAMYSLLRRNPKPSTREIEAAIDGNLCRCTGYRPILEGFYSFSASCCMGPNSKGCPCKEQVSDLSTPSVMCPLDPSQEVIFPPFLSNRSNHVTGAEFDTASGRIFYPVTLIRALELRAQLPDAQCVCGNTTAIFADEARTYGDKINLSNVTELCSIGFTEFGLRLGACCTINQCVAALEDACTSNQVQGRTGIFAGFLRTMRRIASNHIRNIGSIGGNVMWNHASADLRPLLMVADCRLHVSSSAKHARVISSAAFWEGGRPSLQPDELLIAVELPFSQEGETLVAFKQADRNFSLATLTASFYVKLKTGIEPPLIENVKMCYAGYGHLARLAATVPSILIGKSWTNEVAEKACAQLLLDPSTDFGDKYRKVLSASLFLQFFQNPTITLEQGEPMHATQLYQQARPEHQYDLVGRPVMHLSGERHTTGEAIYTGDIPTCVDAVHLAPVISSRAHARLVRVDFSEALALPGVLGCLDHHDIPELGKNHLVTVGDGSDLLQLPETIFATDQVHAVGQMIAVIVANSAEVAREAAKLVALEYEELPAILTIRDALEAKSVYQVRDLACGDAGAALATADHVYSGQIDCGGQEHFYMETQSCLVIPKENGEFDINLATQEPSMNQMALSAFMGVPANKLHVKTLRCGGAFGGKETRPLLLACPATLAASKFNRPAKFCLSRREDMVMTGGRHPFSSSYTIGCSHEGQLTALKLDMYSNCGWSVDFSVFVMDVAMLRGVPYRLPNVDMHGWSLRTNLPSNTAMRAFGAPQGMFILEECVTNLAYDMHMTPETLREMNLIAEGDRQPYGQVMVDCNMSRCWYECQTVANFSARRQQIDFHNAQERWSKKGLAMVPIACGLGFDKTFSQGVAMVNIYLDGSVLIAHGGIEMGQGLHTKVMQVASRALNLPLDLIHVNECVSTDRLPNCTPTGGSMGSDLYAAAVKVACEELLRRLAPYRDASSWKETVAAAFTDRICLSAIGYYRPDIEGTYNFLTRTGGWRYFSFGVACAEVLVDCLTGQHKVQRVDIVMDTGDSLNPAIDIGQIEGGFMQGYGYYCMEEIRFSDSGQYLNLGANAYKIPTVAEVPRQFNVHLLRKSSNKDVVYSSKAIGEPPLMLGYSVYFAVKDAVSAARKEVGLTGAFRLNCPCTPPHVRLACVDAITQQVVQPSEHMLDS